MDGASRSYPSDRTQTKPRSTNDPIPWSVTSITAGGVAGHFQRAHKKASRWEAVFLVRPLVSPRVLGCSLRVPPRPRVRPR